jgi:hypothetical protein
VQTPPSDDNTEGSCRFGTSIPTHYAAWADPDNSGDKKNCGRCFEVKCGERRAEEFLLTKATASPPVPMLPAMARPVDSWFLSRLPPACLPAVNRVFSDGYGQRVLRTAACIDESNAIVVKIVDRCGPRWW